MLPCWLVLPAWLSPFGGLVLLAWLPYSDSWRILSCPRRAAEEVVNLSRIRRLPSPRENTTFDNTSSEETQPLKLSAGMPSEPGAFQQSIKFFTDHEESTSFSVTVTATAR
jgi:hypothetical protein